MNAQYTLDEKDLFLLLGYRLNLVQNGWNWLYTPNSELGNKTPKEAADSGNYSFGECEAVFVSKFGNVPLIIPGETFSPEQLVAILERYPKAVLQNT